MRNCTWLPGAHSPNFSSTGLLVFPRETLATRAYLRADFGVPSVHRFVGIQSRIGVEIRSGEVWKETHGNEAEVHSKLRW